MKKIIGILLLIVLRIDIYACPACKQQQPRLLRGIVHGAGPENGWELGILLLALFIFGYSLLYSVKYLLRPGEPATGHIKHFILDDE